MNPLLLVLGLLALLPMLSAQELAPAEVENLVSRLEARRADAGATRHDFREVKTSPLYSKPLVTTGTFTILAPDRFRRETSGRNRSVMVSNGTDLWIYYPEFQEAEHYVLDESGPGQNIAPLIATTLTFSNLTRNFRLTVERRGDGYKIMATPRSRNLRRFVESVSVTVGKDLEPRQAEWTTPSGDRTVTDFSNERPAKASPKDFEFAPPVGTRVSRPFGK